MRGILERLGMRIETATPAWRVVPPSWRFDIAIEEDLIEEVARVYGFDRIPETDPATVVAIPALSETKLSPESVADLLIQRGYFEAITYSFVDPALQALLCPGEPALRLANPISADLAEMRVSLWPGLVRALIENQRRQQPRVRLFEVGRKFRLDGAALEEIPVVAGLAAGAGAAGAVGRGDVGGRLTSTSRPTSKRCCVRPAPPQDFRFVPAEHPALHPGQSARIVRDDRAVGWIGRLHPEIERRLELTYSGSRVRSRD